MSAPADPYLALEVRAAREMLARINRSIRDDNTTFSAALRGGHLIRPAHDLVAGILELAGIDPTHIGHEVTLDMVSASGCKRRDVVVHPGLADGTFTGLEDHLISIELKSQTASQAKNRGTRDEVLAGGPGLEHANHPARTCVNIEVVYTREVDTSAVDRGVAKWTPTNAALDAVSYRTKLGLRRGNAAPGYHEVRPEAYGLLIVDVGPNGGLLGVHRTIGSLLRAGIVTIDQLAARGILRDDGSVPTGSFGVAHQLRHAVGIYQQRLTRTSRASRRARTTPAPASAAPSTVWAAPTGPALQPRLYVA